MAGKLSAKAQQRLDILLQGKRKVDRLYSLIEQYASARSDAEQLAGTISRAGMDVGRLFLGNGFGVMADHANQLANLARRGGATQTKFRGLRELVSHLRGELDRAEKSVIAEDAEAPGEADA